MDLFETIATRLVLRYLESAVTKDSVDEKLAEAHAALKAYVAKTPSKVDDKLLDVVERVLVGDLAKALEAEALKLLEALAAGTETKIDDELVRLLKKALDVKVAA